jgi:hypothetical protein
MPEQSFTDTDSTKLKLPYDAENVIENFSHILETNQKTEKTGLDKYEVDEFSKLLEHSKEKIKNYSKNKPEDDKKQITKISGLITQILKAEEKKAEEKKAKIEDLEKELDGLKNKKTEALLTLDEEKELLLLVKEGTTEKLQSLEENFNNEIGKLIEKLKSQTSAMEEFFNTEEENLSKELESSLLQNNQNKINEALSRQDALTKDKEKWNAISKELLSSVKLKSTLKAEIQKLESAIDEVPERTKNKTQELIDNIEITQGHINELKKPKDLTNINHLNELQKSINKALQPTLTSKVKTIISNTVNSIYPNFV